MSEIKNSGLDQYGKVCSLNGIGGERVKVSSTQISYLLHVQTNTCTTASNTVTRNIQDKGYLYTRSTAIPDSVCRPDGSHWRR